MDVMNVVLAVDRDPNMGFATRFLIGVADRATRNWIERPSLMAAPFVAKRIRAGARFETFYIGEAGPDLALRRQPDGQEAVVSVPQADAGFSLEDLPPCGMPAGSSIYRCGKPV